MGKRVMPLIGALCLAGVVSAGPADFNAHWAEAVKNAERTPLNLKWKRDWRAEWTHLVYLMSFDATGGTVQGYLSLPQLPGKSLPAEITIADGGPGFLGPIYSADHVVLALNLYPRSEGYSWQESHEKLCFDARVKDAVFRGAPDRERYTLRRALLGMNRAVDWLATRQEVDPERIEIHAFGQGAALGLMLAGLNGHVKTVVADKPVFCDLLAENGAGWPDFRKQLGDTPEVRDFAAYYDVVNFAPGIKAEARFIVGEKDTVASPSSIQVAYDRVRAPKSIIVEPVGHVKSERKE